MNWQSLAASIVLLISSSLSALLSILLWRRRKAPGSRSLALLMLAVTAWSLTAAMENNATSLTIKVLWSKVEYLGITSSTALFLIFSLEYSQLDNWLTKRNIFLISVIPTLTVGIAFTNDWHHWLWSDFTFAPSPNSNRLIYHYGTWFWIHLIYSYSMLAIGSALLIQAALRFRRIYRRQVVIILAAIAVPWGANIIYTIGLPPLRGLELTPIAFTFTGFMLAWGLYRFDLFNLVPVARDKLVDTLPDIVIVLDSQYRVVDANPEAQKVIGLGSNQTIGKPATQALTAWPYLDRRFETSKDIPTEVASIQDTHGHWYDLRITPLRNRRSQVTGHLLVLHDITERKQYETDLVKQAAKLKSVAQISAAITTTLEVQKLIQEVVDLTQIHFDLYHVQVYLVGDHPETLMLTAGSGETGRQLIHQGMKIHLQQQQSLVARAARSKIGVIVNEIHNDPDHLPNPLLPRTRAEMAVPLIFGDNMFGVLDLQSDQLNYFASQELSIFTTLAAQVAGALSNAHTFTRLQSTLKELAQHQVQLRETMQIARLGSYEIDLTTQTVYLNDGFYELHNTVADLRSDYQLSIDTFLSQFVHPGDAPLLGSDFQTAIASPAVNLIEREYRYLYEDRIRYMLLRAKIERNSEKVPVKVTGSVQDITEAVKAQAEIARLATVIDQASETIVLTDLDGIIVYANPQFEKITGYSLQEVLGQNPRILKSGQQDSEFYQGLWNTIAAGKNWQGTFINKRKDGSLYHESATIFPIKSANGTITHYAAVKRDITIQVQLEEAEREQRRLAEAYTKELTQREQFLSMLNDITKVALEQTNFQQLLQFLANRLGDLLGADGCYITLFDEETGQVLPGAAYGPLQEKYPKLKPIEGETTLTQSVLSAGRPLTVEDVFNSPYISPRIAALFPERSMMGLPLIANNKRLGAALISFAQPHSFSTDEIARGEHAAGQISLAIAKAQALEAAERQARQAETLRQAVAAVAETLNQDVAINRILEQINRVVPYDSASVQLLQKNSLVIVGGRGFQDLTIILGMSFPISGENPSAVVFETRQPFIIEDAQREYAFFRQPPHNHIRGWMGVPIVFQKRFIGILSLDSVKPGAFTRDHARMAVAFADQVAVALENARLYGEVHRLAITDSLTGLYNRRHFFDLARAECNRSKRYGHSFSIMMLDIDHFKRINDSYGHVIGDQLLQAIAKLCAEAIRNVDILGRYGGEEFIFLLPETHAEKAHQVAERLRKRIASTSVITESQEISITVSIGISISRCGSHKHGLSRENLEKLIDQADQALYQAKQSGRNRVIIYQTNTI